MEDLEDRYSIFYRDYYIDLKAIEEAAFGGGGGGLDNYYTKVQADVITNALDARIDVLEAASGPDLSNYYTKGEVNTALSAKQNTNTVLTELINLTPSNNDIIQRKASAWTTRTPAQFKQDLSLDNVNNTSDANKPVSTATQAALDALDSRIDVLEAPVVTALTDASTVTPNAATGKNFSWSVGANRTLAAPSNPTDGQGIVIAALASGADRTLTIDSAIKLTTGITNSIVIPSGKRQFLGLRYVDSVGWFLLASTQEL